MPQGPTPSPADWEHLASTFDTDSLEIGETCFPFIGVSRTPCALGVGNPLFGGCYEKDGRVGIDIHGKDGEVVSLEITKDSNGRSRNVGYPKRVLDIIDPCIPRQFFPKNWAQANRAFTLTMLEKQFCLAEEEKWDPITTLHSLIEYGSGTPVMKNSTISTPASTPNTSVDSDRSSGNNMTGGYNLRARKPTSPTLIVRLRLENRYQDIMRIIQDQNPSTVPSSGDKTTTTVAAPVVDESALEPGTNSEAGGETGSQPSQPSQALPGSNKRKRDAQDERIEQLEHRVTLLESHNSRLDQQLNALRGVLLARAPQLNVPGTEVQEDVELSQEESARGSLGHAASRLPEVSSIHREEDQADQET